MRIGFDVRPFLKKETGVGVYFKNLLFHLSQIDESNEYFLFSSSFKDRFPRQKIPPFSRKHFRDLRIPVKVLNFLWYKFSWPPLEYFFKTDLDLTHSPTPLVLPTKGKKIVTVYDLFFMDFPWMTHREARKDFVRQAEDSFLKADGIVAISQFTKDQLLRKFSVEEKKVEVIHLGLNPEFKVDVPVEEMEKIKAKYSLPSSFILFVGAIEPRKNLLNLVDALKIIHKKHQRVPLLVVGKKGQDYNNLESKIRQNELESWVKIMGYLPDKDVRTLYSLASVFVFPSLCEGFGLPLLEAMASGAPVVTSDCSAMPEIAQEAALYFNPKDPDDIADRIIQILLDEDLGRNLRAKGKKKAFNFDWEDTAARTLRFYESLS